MATRPDPWHRLAMTVRGGLPEPDPPPGLAWPRRPAHGGGDPLDEALRWLRGAVTIAAIAVVLALLWPAGTGADDLLPMPVAGTDVP